MPNFTPPFEASRAERAFIGAVINGDTQMRDHALAADDFTDAFCRRLFGACAQLDAQGKRPDLVTLMDFVPELEADALIALTTEASIDSALVPQYAAAIRGAAQRRNFAGLCLKAAVAAREGTVPLEEVADKLRAGIDEQAAAGDADGLVSGTDALVDFALWLDRTEDEPAISTGLPRLDQLLGGGLRNERFYVIGARTGVGKSALMAFIATKAIIAGRRVLYVSCEMGARENVARMVACASGVDIAQLTARSTLTDGQRCAVVDSFGAQLRGGERFRFSTTARTPADIRRAALRMRADGGLDLLVVDYIQILQAGVRTSGRVEAVGEITRALKLLAMELNVPLLSAAQINRAAVNSGGAPRLSDLRESGSIEQDADVVILLHRPDGQESSAVKTLDIAVAKNRQGRLGAEKLVFDGAFMRFGELDAG